HHHSRVREAAVSVLGTLGRFAPEPSLERQDARDELVDYLSDPWLRVRIRSAEALKMLGDKTALHELRDHAAKELDGRARRAMRLAEREIREQTQPSEELERLRDEVKMLEQSHTKLQDRMEKLETKKAPPPPTGKGGKKKKKAKGSKKSKDSKS